MTEEEPPRQPALIARDLRDKQELYDDVTSRHRHGAYALQVKIQQFKRELQEAREFWIRRVV